MRAGVLIVVQPQSRPRRQPRHTYAGLSPGSVGLYQLNVVVPDAAAPAADFVRYVGVAIRVNGIAAQTVLLRVQ